MAELFENEPIFYAPSIQSKGISMNDDTKLAEPIQQTLAEDGKTYSGKEVAQEGEVKAEGRKEVVPL